MFKVICLPPRNDLTNKILQLGQRLKKMRQHAEIRGESDLGGKARKSLHVVKNARLYRG